MLTITENRHPGCVAAMCKKLQRLYCMWQYVFGAAIAKNDQLMICQRFHVFCHVNIEGKHIVKGGVLALIEIVFFICNENIDGNV